MFCPKCGQEMLLQARSSTFYGTDGQSLLQQQEAVPLIL